MPLSLKQARRMVAKSRRRVWRLCRVAGITSTYDPNLDRDAHALMLARIAPRVVAGKHRQAAHALCNELGARVERLREMVNAHTYTAHVLDEAGPYCPVCGAELERQDCEAGCDDGLYDAHELYPLEYSPGELETCECCGGAGGYWFCPEGHAQRLEVSDA